MSELVAAIIDGEGQVTNLILVPSADFTLEGLTLVPAPDGAAQIGDSWDGASFHRAPPPAPTLADYSSAVQVLLDGAAQARDYADIVSAVSYAGSGVATWAAEGAAFAAWRDAVWLAVYAALAAVEAGSRPQPSVEDLLAELPAFLPPA